MFSRWPPPSKPEDIPALVRQLADGFVKEAKDSRKFALDREKYDVEQFAGDHCKGTCVVFQIKKRRHTGNVNDERKRRDLERAIHRKAGRLEGSPELAQKHLLA